MLRRTEWLHDDHLPYLCAMTGIALFAEAFGCPVQLAKNSEPAARPLVTSSSEADHLHFPELSSSSLAFLFDLADAMRHRAGTPPLLLMPGMNFPMDLVGMIWDKSDLFCAMVETPEAVKRLADEAKNLTIASNDEWISRYGAERIAHWPDVYIERGVCLKVGAIGNEMFGEFFLSDLIELSQRYGGPVSPPLLPTSHLPSPLAQACD